MPPPWIALTLAAVLGQAPIGPATGTPYRGASAASDMAQVPAAAGSNPIYVGPRSGVQQSPVPQPQINPVRRASAADPQSTVTPLGTYSPPADNTGRPQGRAATASGPMGRQAPATTEADPLARIREEAYRSEVARRQAERAQLQGLSSIPNPLQRRPAVAPPQVLQASNTATTDPRQARIRELQLRIEQQRQHLRALEEALQQEVQLAR